jgi:hypothetical protein
MPVMLTATSPRGPVTPLMFSGRNSSGKSSVRLGSLPVALLQLVPATPAMPGPLSWTVCGPPRAPSSILSVPDAGPTVLGEKVTSMRQSAAEGNIWAVVNLGEVGAGGDRADSYPSHVAEQDESEIRGPTDDNAAEIQRRWCNQELLRPCGRGNRGRRVWVGSWRHPPLLACGG